MHYYKVSPIGVVRGDAEEFTYSYNSPLKIGTLVRVEVGKKTYNAVVTKNSTQPNFATKEVSQIIEERTLPTNLVKLAFWLKEYYATHLGLVWQTILPRGLGKNRRQQKSVSREAIRNRTNFLLNKHQRQAVEAITSSKNQAAILHGVTGSGKTAVYIELAKQALLQNKSAIILTPEIALTSQLVDEFSQHFADNLLLTHSRQTEAERHLIWQKVLNASQPLVIIGPRSALFMPLQDIGLIVIDEFHEPSYKQEQSPRYLALRVASKLAQLNKGAKVVLGSATPSISEYYLAQKLSLLILQLPTSAQEVKKPELNLIDMTQRDNFKQHRFLSDAVLRQLKATFALHKQVLIFHNRRGSAPTTLCENCSWQAGCPNCFLPLTLHTDTHLLRCHVCNFNTKIPLNCPNCQQPEIVHKGIGTKLIESELRKLFPTIKIARFDGDSPESVEQKYKEIYNGEIDLIIGTQVVAKGLDLPNLRSVVVVQADTGLSLPDFSAGERTFQLLAQAVGRVGRQNKPTNVTVQSYQPDHPAVKYGLKQDFESFYNYALKLRRHASFPPFSYVLKLTCVYKTEAAAIKNAKKLAETLRPKLITGARLLGPAPAFYERKGKTFRWQLIVKSPERAHLLELLKELPAAHWQFEIDPINLL